MIFFLGLHQPADAGKVGVPCMISANRIWSRKKPVDSAGWIMDSGAFSEIANHGGYRAERSPEQYAAVINRFTCHGGLLAAVAQDYMCEPFMLEKTGLSITDHQRLTVDRYDALINLTRAYVMPVLQGYDPQEYVRHLNLYGDRLQPGAWVGVGSVCKRNGTPRQVESVLLAIKNRRPDLRLHGFGVKTKTLASSLARDLLYSADSMAWSFAARKAGESANDWRQAKAFFDAIHCAPAQINLLTI